MRERVIPAQIDGMSITDWRKTIGDEAEYIRQAPYVPEVRVAWVEVWTRSFARKVDYRYRALVAVEGDIERPLMGWPEGTPDDAIALVRARLAYDTLDAEMMIRAITGYYS